jgi:hypothetical protein
LSFAGFANAQPQTGDTMMVPFRRGEKLLYRVYFKSFITGKVTAGDLTLEVTHNNKKFNGRGTYHLQCVGKSRGTFNWFMKIEDKFESYIDEKSLVPWYFSRKIREGHYKKDEEVEFFPDQNLAISPKAVKKIPSMIQDILSAYYYTRTTDFTKMNPGEEFTLPIFFDDSIFVSRIICHNRETIQTQLGSFSCVSFRPMVMVGNVFNDRYPLTVWITDDENKIPVLIRSSLVLGRIEVELVGSSGLAKPFLSSLDSKTVKKKIP